MIDNSSLQPNRNREGSNTVPWNVAGWPRTRIGIVSNQENDLRPLPDSVLSASAVTREAKCNVGGYSRG